MTSATKLPSSRKFISSTKASMIYQAAASWGLLCQMFSRPKPATCLYLIFQTSQSLEHHYGNAVQDALVQGMYVSAAGFQLPSLSFISSQNHQKIRLCFRIRFLKNPPFIISAPNTFHKVIKCDNQFFSNTNIQYRIRGNDQVIKG